MKLQEIKKLLSSSMIYYIETEIGKFFIFKDVINNKTKIIRSVYAIKEGKDKTGIYNLNDIIKVIVTKHGKYVFYELYPISEKINYITQIDIVLALVNQGAL